MIDLWSLINLSNSWSTNIGASCSNIPDAFKMAQWDNLIMSNILSSILHTFIIYILNIFKAWCLMLTCYFSGYVHPPCHGWNSLKSSNYIQKEEEISNLCINKYIFAYFWHPSHSEKPYHIAISPCYLGTITMQRHPMNSNRDCRFGFNYN